MKRAIYGLIFTLGLILLVFLKYYEAPVNFTKAADTKSNITATINATREQPVTSLHPVEKPSTSNTFCELPENFRMNFDNFKVQFLKKKATLWLLEGERRRSKYTGFFCGLLCCIGVVLLHY
ncbi:hypothetical protein [Lacimicrobium alkaliphilum]|uniref:Uncharacterized protein n=1 Tax=Lacimicrobium alkaliphilum TaxID=1526571 RepID=A0ABQ1RSI2_9ALTE|nr:hypothetical protein [Lacimicrobium alkaliphilum]GGD78988.1 hypothetical protein GCM10011357_37490 [Lacimicrobium alkaliphilum]